MNKTDEGGGAQMIIAGLFVLLQLQIFMATKNLP
jgi:hypothetical protein